MPTSIANISWIRPAGSTGTLIEYKPSSSTTWVQPTSPDNPTLATTYPLTIEDNVSYDVRLTNFGARCTPRATTFEIFAAVNNCCPVGYTLSPDGTFCQQVNTTAATPPSGSENAVAVSGPNNFYYGIFGSLIFDPGYNVNGTGTFTQIPYTNGFWVNGTGYPTYPSASNTQGPLNRAGLWSPTVLNPQQVGFSICISAPSTGVYYVGMACDDFGQIIIDGTTIVSQDRTALKTYIQANGYPYPVGLDPNQITFNFWYIYPITLTQGNHTVEIIGNNTSGTVPGAADLGCEIYNLTSSQIQSATSYADMGSGLIFSSKDFVGQPIQIGSGGIGYTCPPGYSLVLCSGPAFCTQTLTTPIIPCTTTTTTTTSTSTTTTTTHTTTTTSTTTTTTTT